MDKDLESLREIHYHKIDTEMRSIGGENLTEFVDSMMNLREATDYDDLVKRGTAAFKALQAATLHPSERANLYILVTSLIHMEEVRLQADMKVPDDVTIH